ncbi:MAG TPA: MarR family transcriptional regulator [Candidatus Sulfotelmatobacter sp.]
MIEPQGIAVALRTSLVFHIEMAIKMISKRTDRWLQKTVGCNRRELWVLMCISEMGCSQRQLSDVLRVHPNMMVGLIDGMERKSLVKRTKAISNRRQYVIELTPRGKKALSLVRARRDPALKYIFEPLETSQVDQIREWSMLILQGRKGISEVVDMDDTDA